MTADDCPSPASCPVPIPSTALDPGRLRLEVIQTGRVICRSYQLVHGYDTFNPGVGDTRFAPLSADERTPIPTMYAGEDDAVALLESVFHDIHHQVPDRVVYYSIARRWGLAYVRVPRPLSLIDLRNDALTDLGLERGQIVTTQAEHYPCTRQWARWLYGQSPGGVAPDGILWHSRQAELHVGAAAREVLVLFGDRAPSQPGAYPLVGPGVRNLTEGLGRGLLERLAEDMGARVEPDD